MAEKCGSVRFQLWPWERSGGAPRVEMEIHLEAFPYLIPHPPAVDQVINSLIGNLEMPTFLIFLSLFEILK